MLKIIDPHIVDINPEPDFMHPYTLVNRVHLTKFKRELDRIFFLEKQNFEGRSIYRDKKINTI